MASNKAVVTGKGRLGKNISRPLYQTFTLNANATAIKKTRKPLAILLGHLK
jgi:hypothetical protein